MYDNNVNARTARSQRYRILTALNAGEELTSITMLERFGAYDGRKRISELRAAGFPIKDRDGFNPNTKKHFHIYYIDVTDREAVPV